MKLFDPNMGELMAVSALERDGNDLIIKGKIYGSMPIKAKLSPEEARKVFGLLSLRTVLFILSMPFRKSATPQKIPQAAEPHNQQESHNDSN